MEVTGLISTLGMAGSVCLPSSFPMRLSRGILGRTFSRRIAGFNGSWEMADRWPFWSTVDAHSRSPAARFNGITLEMASVFCLQGDDWQPVGLAIDSERRFAEDFQWGTGTVGLPRDGIVLPVLGGGQLEHSGWRSDVSGYNACNEADVEMVRSFRVFDLGLAATSSPTDQTTLAHTEAPIVATTDHPTTMAISLPSPASTGSDSTCSGQDDTGQATLDPTSTPSIVTFNPTDGPTEATSAAFAKSPPALSLGVLTASTVVLLESLLW
jgi:hypothetical protein